jgi:hypothetical protein
MPEPMPTESRRSFIGRCMDDKKMLEQFSNSAQRYAVCNSYADKSAEYALDPEKGNRPIEDMIGMSEMIGEADGYLGMADDTSQANTHSDTLNSIIEAAQFGTIILDEATVEEITAAEYQGKKVTLDKPFRMPKGNSKKFGVYTKNDKSNVVLVRFGDPNMEIRRDDDEARKNYRSRMGCDTPRVGPKWKANYWSCKMWEKGKSVKDYTGNLEESQRSSE